MSDQWELLKLQSNANEPDKSESGKLIEREEVPGTRFIIVGTQKTGYFVTFGKYQVTHTTTKEECRELIEKKDWELVFALMSIAAEYWYEQKIRDKMAENS